MQNSIIFTPCWPSAGPTGGVANAIEKIFENPKLIEQKSLRDLIFGIRQLTKINAGIGNKDYQLSAQIVDFHETLEYKVYFQISTKV